MSTCQHLSAEDGGRRPTGAEWGAPCVQSAGLHPSPAQTPVVLMAAVDTVPGAVLTPFPHIRDVQSEAENLNSLSKSHS